MKRTMPLLLVLCVFTLSYGDSDMTFDFEPPVSLEKADARAQDLLDRMTLEEKIQFVGGHNTFFIKGYDHLNIKELYLADATQGVHIRRNLDNRLKKSTAFPCPLALTATWNTDLTREYAKSIGEECRAGGIAVLLGPGMNMYRMSQNGRNFEYFGEDPYLAARLIENYVIALQNTGTLATLKHFVANNTDHYRRRSNSVVDDRTLHEIYLPAFKAGIDAGAMAVMTAYNQVNGEWAAQSRELVTGLLRRQLGFKWLVMSDWWSTFDAEKTIKSGLDLEMPGEHGEWFTEFEREYCQYVKESADSLIESGIVSEKDIDRMAFHILRTVIAMGLYDRPIKDASYLDTFPQHEEIALQTARESIVLLKNSNHILPVSPKDNKTILLTGDFVTTIARGQGAASVEGYNHVQMLDALKKVYGEQLNYIETPTETEIKAHDIVLLSIGTIDSEGWDQPFAFPDSVNERVLHTAALNPNTVALINTGSGRKMTDWHDKVAAILYCWYPGQNGNTALAEIISGAVSPSGKLPISIEKEFSDSPGYHYLPDGDSLYQGWEHDGDLKRPIYDIVYTEGVFMGYRWYDSKQIEPLYPFGYGLSYSTFEYSHLKIEQTGSSYKVQFKITNTGEQTAAETAQLYVIRSESSVPRPEKELKGFAKVELAPRHK
ncbi:MAG: glycoside hydrolase family 3 C-terminal domain-containing protein [candidate division KSB1 bacterium]|nr:glycoside hydrolase family 3 C-terminal domain-containing protein [candidate division KSB1 bacterium]